MSRRRKVQLAVRIEADDLRELVNAIERLADEIDVEDELPRDAILDTGYEVRLVALQ